MMKRSIKVLIMLIITMMLLFSQFPAMAETLPESGKPELMFNTEGKFRILMINDTQDTNKTLKDTIKLVESSLDKVKPDLVVLVGDNIAGYWLGVNPKRVATAIDNIVKPINDRNIPFAVVFGNHDQESGVSKEDQMKLYRSYKNCLAVDEGDSLSNCGTYQLLIKDSKGEKNVFNLWMMDSGTSSSSGGYESVHEDQIAWYIRTSNTLKEQNGGEPLPSLLFQHIPVPEIYNLMTVVPEGTQGAVRGYRTQSHSFYLLNTGIAQGKLLEPPCSPDTNSGEFDAWLKQGDILGAYFGHDHVNDFMGSFRGIDLGYSPGSGFYQYGNGVYRGVRTFELDEQDLDHYQTEVLYYKDLVAPEAGISIFDSYFNCELRVAIPLFLTAFILFLILILITLTVIKKIRRKPAPMN